MNIDWAEASIRIGYTFNSFLNSNFMLAIKILIAVYVTVLFVDIILLLILRGVGGDIRTAIKGVDMPTESKKKMQKKWTRIENRLQSGEESQYKVAILEADNFVDSILKRIGHKGENMSKKLDNVKAGQIEEADFLREVHLIRNRIIKKEEFSISKEEAQRIINMYKEFLENLELM